jgi:hypothetical protein
MSGDTVTIKKAYLSALAAGQHKLTFDMSGGSDPTLSITVRDGGIPSADWTNPFADVDPSAWYYGDVKYVSQNGLFAGTGAAEFSPNMPMTRGMLVTVLGRLMGADTGRHAQPGFDDVAAGRYYAASVGWAKENGLVAGVGDNLFLPDAEVTRQDIAVILRRSARFMDVDLPENKKLQPFADDNDIASYAVEALYAMQQAGVIGGKPGNMADPRGSATRAEVAAMLHRFAAAHKES